MFSLFPTKFSLLRNLVLGQYFEYLEYFMESELCYVQFSYFSA